MTSQARKLDDFRGGWSLRRTISHADGTKAEFSGKAVWHPHEQGLRYLETGQLVVNGHTSFHAEREYLWLPDLSVLFDDGRFFHNVPSNGGEARHWCDPDDYVVSYDFADWPEFTTNWRVKGPRKDYVMVSSYTPECKN